eukprot:gb/GEZN01009818.1/.p1 GENE.gb/GEZN01009818.1/~~gb/GEZN01009818.1/.p1  ORF type:complete len:415 (+),score=-3.46 gb/GEZN01009818.1/:178-1245(+)
MEKTKVYTPLSIRRQMLFSNWLMLSMFLSATLVGLLAVHSLEAVGLAKRSPKGPTALGFGLLRGYGGSILGGFLLGCGMTLSGACPGTIFAQLGAGVPDAWATFVGAMVATIVFAYMEKIIKMRLVKFMASGSLMTVDSMCHGSVSLGVIIAVFSLCLVIILVVVNVLTDWRDDAQQTVMNYGVNELPYWAFRPKQTAWNPVLGGIVLGLLQIPSFVGAGTGLGASSTFVTAAAWLASVVDSKWQSNAPYLVKFHYGFGNFWQVALVAGISLGSYLSAKLGKVELVVEGPIASHHIGVNFIGGFLLLWGARLAGGCTSGHGITGMAQLSVASIVSVCAMFAGGILVAFIGYSNDR